MPYSAPLKYALGLTASLCATLGTALAGEQRNEVVTPPPPVSAWEFRIEPYLWASGLNGTTGVRHFTSDVNVPFKDVFSHLDMAAALQFEARKGRWGFVADGFYAKLSASGSIPTPLDRTADVGIKQFTGDLYAAYRFAESSTGFVDAYAGIRDNYMSLDLSARGPTHSLDLWESENWIDPIVGLRGQWNINEKFFLAAQGDIGGFGVGADFAWALQGTAGYNFTNKVSAELGYRYYKTDYSNGGFNYNIAASGMMLGVNIKF